MMTQQQMNDYLLKNAEQKIKDSVNLSERLLWAYRTWVLTVIKNGKDQLMSKPTSENGSGAGGGESEANAGGGENAGGSAGGIEQGGESGGVVGAA